MKKKSIHNFQNVSSRSYILRFAILFCILFVLACDDQETSIEIPIYDSNISNQQQQKIEIKALQDLWRQYQRSNQNESILTLGENNQYIEAYVISDDRYGNFYKRLIVQDYPENPTAGIQVLINNNDLYTHYKVGQQIKINLNNLSLSQEYGIVTLGIQYNNELKEIPEKLQYDVIDRFNNIQDIVPTSIDIATIHEEQIATYLAIDHVQFENTQYYHNNTFAGSPLDEYEGVRELKSCNDGLTSFLSTSTYSDFKSLALPKKNGVLKGILTKNYNQEYFQWVINKPQDLIFNDEICTESIFSCDSIEFGNENDTILIIENDFEDHSKNTVVKSEGWTNYSNNPNQQWETFSSSGINASKGISAKISAEGSERYPFIAWLITPSFQILDGTNTILEFETSTSYANQSKLEVLVSTDWDGDVSTLETTEWRKLDQAYIALNENNYSNWYASGTINLSCLSNTNAHIAFKYTASDTEGFNGTYELDEIRIRTF